MRTIALVAGMFLAAAVRADDPYFDEKVRPIFEASCVKCHSHAAKKSKGGLVVDSRAALLKGGDSGPAVVPGEPDKSLLVEAIRYGRDDLRMPPNGKLPEEQIVVLVEWVKRGAPWPGSAESAAARTPGTIDAKDRDWWAFRPLSSVPPPKVDAGPWSENPIDRFVLDRLRAEGLKPSPPADRRTLIRRVTFDLIGLPPTPDEIAAFEKDAAVDAYDRLVDRLLASPRYGEKWARHWLDLVRYAESDGYRLDEYRPAAWRYRDYVVRSLNADKPYDRFVQEQLAGDELFPDDPEALTATAFLRHWIYEYNQRDVRVQWQNVLDDITEVTAEAFLALGIGCARCHDHKFDPILQKDFYRLQAFFAAIRPVDDETLASPAQKAEHRAKLDAWRAKVAPTLNEIDELTRADKKSAETAAIKKFQPDIQAILRKAESQRTPIEKQLAALAYRQVTYEFERIDKKIKKAPPTKLVELEKRLAPFEAERPAPLPVGFAVRDVGSEAPPIFVPKKTRGEPIAPGFPSVIDPAPAEIAAAIAGSTGRRATLARWLTRPEHPLTSRTIVNRVWQQHFGRGLVGTPNDFGKLGDLPTHPELLDWLARDFTARGWSFKKLHRLIATSMTYRQSATSPAPEIAVRKDPQNLLLWRANVRRLQAEPIRDAILSVAGRLDLAEGGPSVDPATPRRSIYTKLFRNNRDPLLDVFDAPEGVASVGQRNVTTTPTQALLMINSPFMVDQAKALAARLDRIADETDRLRTAFLLTFGREPSADDVRQSRAFLAEQTSRAGRSDAAWVDFCQTLLNANEFLYVD